MRYGKRFRLTPPWPPGLESIKKALLGPARYRRTLEPSIKPLAPYDDTLLVALAIQAHLNGSTTGFTLETPGLRLNCRLMTSISPLEFESILTTIQDPSQLTPEDSMAQLMASEIAIEAYLDHGEIRHRSWICRKTSNARGLKWNAAFNTALALLRKRQAVH